MSEHSATSKMKKNMKGLTLPGGDIAAPPAAAPTGDHIEYVYSVSKLQCLYYVIVCYVNMEYSKTTFYCVKDVQLHVVIYMVSETVLFKYTCNSVFFFFFFGLIILKYPRLWAFSNISLILSPRILDWFILIINILAMITKACVWWCHTVFKIYAYLFNKGPNEDSIGPNFNIHI